MAFDLTDPPRYIPIAIFTIGLCYSGRTTPHKTVEVKSDTHERARKEGWDLLKPSTVEHVRIIDIRPNPDHLRAMGKIAD